MTTANAIALPYSTGTARTFTPNIWQSDTGITEWLTTAKDIPPLPSVAMSLPSFSLFPGDGEALTPFQYNRVDGLLLGVGSHKRYATTWLPHFLWHYGLGYGSGSHYWQTFAGLEYALDSSDLPTVVGIEGHHHTYTYDAWKLSAWENTAFTFFAGQDDRNYVKRSGWSIRLEYHPVRALQIRLRFGQNYYESLPRTTRWSLFGNPESLRKNPNFSAGWINAASLAAQYYTTMHPLLSNHYAGINLRIERGRRNYDYERYLLQAVYHYSGAIATWNLRLRMGSLRGDAFIPLVFTLGGTGSLAGFPINTFSGNRLFLLNSELLLHLPQGQPSNFLTGLSIIIFTGIGSTQMAHGNAGAFHNLIPSALEQWKMDYGIALGSRHGAWRVGAAWRTDRSALPHLVFRLARPW